MDNQSQFFYSSIFKISISPKNYHFSSLDWAFKLICEKSGINGLLELRDIIFTLRDEYESNPKAKTSPRWQKIRELMENIDFDSLKDKETN